MLTHVVVWKYRSDIDIDIREEHVTLLRNLSAVIPQVKSLSVGSDTLHLPRSYDTGLVAVFEDFAALVQPNAEMRMEIPPGQSRGLAKCETTACRRCSA